MGSSQRLSLEAAGMKGEERTHVLGDKRQDEAGGGETTAITHAKESPFWSDCSAVELGTLCCGGR